LHKRSGEPRSVREEMSRGPAPRSKPPDVTSGAKGCSAASPLRRHPALAHRWPPSPVRYSCPRLCGYRFGRRPAVGVRARGHRDARVRKLARDSARYRVCLQAAVLDASAIEQFRCHDSREVIAALDKPAVALRESF
jgi:hypothetical protein